MAEMSAIKKFLIVDDSAVERVLFRSLLKRHWPQCEIIEACDGVEGLQAFEKEMPDLVLTDLCMPRSGGMELLAALRDKECVVPVVVMSGGGNEEATVAALNAGASSYVPKLQAQQLLVSTISTVMELATTHYNRRQVIGCLRNMDLQFELENDHSLVAPMIKCLEDHIGSLRLCDEYELVRIGVALHESMSNAINHGNLELDSELRQEEEGIYYELAEARKLIWPYCDRRVHIFASLNSDHVRFVIRDEGPGFNHRKVQDPTKAENIERIGGRGLLLIRSFMDDVSYNSLGNEITLVKYTSAGKKLLAKMAEEKLGCSDLEMELTGGVVLFDDELAESLEAV